MSDVIRAAPLVLVKAKFTVKNVLSRVGVARLSPPQRTITPYAGVEDSSHVAFFTVILALTRTSGAALTPSPP